MSEKARKFQQLFKQKSFLQTFDIGGEISDLFKLLDESEIDRLVVKNVQFIRSCSPSSTIILEDINLTGNLTVINFDTAYRKSLHAKEFIAILLHEIGHVFNPELKGMDAEFAADEFAKMKGYGKWIITGLEKGVKNKWMGFEEASCKLRIDKLSEK